ncbi:MAG: ATP-binding protein, partial [Polaromonas sp.]
VQTVTDTATEVSGAKVGAFFYNTCDESGKAFLLYTLSGARREDFEKFGNPRATALFGPTFAGAPPIRIDDVLQDPRYGQWAPHHGMPPEHLPVRSYLAVPVASGSGEVIGGLFFGHPQVGMFNDRAERLVTSIAAQAGVAIDNAQLYERAQHAAQEREKLLESERIARGDAEEMVRMKDEFLAMLAHELRNPLAPLRNSVEILRRVAANPSGLEKTRAIMDRQLAHMTRLVDDLLDISRVSRGKLEMRLEQSRLADALRSAVETSRPAVADRQHQLRLALPGDDVIVHGDQIRLSQAFTNLLNNAAKYTPEGGVVELKAVTDTDGITVSVEDTGIGIPEHLRDRVFDMFVQGEASPYTPKAQGGLGIGLTLVRKIIEMHGGNVRVESRAEGRGTQFTVWLPRVAAQPAVAASPPVSPASLFQPRRILVADDNTDAASTLAQLLGVMGHEVRTAGDGVDAVNVADSFSPDLVILDIGMPRMDGYEACRQIRKLQGSGARATIVALTGWGQPEDKQRAVDAGFDLHLTKPVDPQQLEALAGSGD